MKLEDNLIKNNGELLFNIFIVIKEYVFLKIEFVVINNEIG